MTMETQILEERIQAEFDKWLWNTYPRTRYLCYAIPNGVLRKKSEAARLKAQGVRPGVPDYHIAIAASGYHSLYIEFKQPGKVTTRGEHAENQHRVQLALRQAGHRVEVCDDLAVAQRILKDYLADTDYLIR